MLLLDFLEHGLEVHGVGYDVVIVWYLRPRDGFEERFSVTIVHCDCPEVEEETFERLVERV